MGRHRKRGRKRKIRNPAALQAHCRRIARAKEVEADHSRQRRFERAFLSFAHGGGEEGEPCESAWLSDGGSFVRRWIEKREITPEAYYRRIHWAIGILPRKYYRYKSLVWHVCTSSSSRDQLLARFELSARRYYEVLDLLTLHYWKFTSRKPQKGGGVKKS